MAEGLNNLAGGFLTGLVGSKNKAREMALNEEYKKIAMENVKATAKLHEAQIKKADLEGNLLQWAMGGESPAGMTQPQTTPQAPAQPFAQYKPMVAPAPSPQAASPQELTQMIAGMQNPLNPTGGQAPPLPYLNGPTQGLSPDLSTRLASMAEEFYKQTGQPLKITDGFRTYDQQADVYRRKPNLAVPPGTSKHEKGLAVDVDTSQVPLLEQTGLIDKYGFVRPALASKGETWHLELSPTGGGLGTSGQAIPPQAPMQPQEAAPILTREKFLKGYLKKNFGVEDEKFDYRISKSGDIIVLSGGQIRNRIPGGENSEWKELPTGGYALLDKTSKQVLQVIPMPKPYQVSGKTGEGDVTHGFIYPGGTPGVGATGGTGGMSGAVITEPAPNKLPGTLPETVRTKIADNNAIIDQLNILGGTFNKDFVGASGMFGKAIDATSGYTGWGDPQRQTWNQIYNEMLGQKLHTRGGSALTKQEIAYVMNTLPLVSHNPDLFKSGIEAAKMLLMASNYELQAAHLTPDKAKFEKAAADLLQQYKTKFKPLMERGLKMGPAPAGVTYPLPQGAKQGEVFDEGGVKKIIGPDGKKYRWVE